MTVHKLTQTTATSIDTEELTKQLLSRFYVQSQIGSSKRYYDIATDESNLLEGNIIGAMMIANGIDDYRACADTLNRCKHLMRYLVPNVTQYVPNAPKIVMKKGLHYLNTWKNDGIAPYQVNSLEEATKLCKPFLDFLERALKIDNRYVLEQLAMLVQEPLPVVKRPVAVYLYGASQGQGKNLLMNVVAKVLGTSSVRLAGARSLRDQNLVQLFDRSLLVIDEADIKVKGQLYETLKHLITESETEAALKHQAMRTLQTPAQLYMLSNNPPSFLDQADRRFLVCEFDTGLRGSEKDQYFEGLVSWLENEEGYSKVASLLSLYDCSSYNRTSAAPMTETKRRILGSFSEGFTEDLKDYVEDNSLRVLDTQDSFLEQLQLKYNLNAKQLQHAMNEAGYSKHPSRIKVLGKPFRIYHRHDDVICTQSGMAAYVKDKQGNRTELNTLMSEYIKDSKEL